MAQHTLFLCGLRRSLMAVAGLRLGGGRKWLPRVWFFGNEVWTWTSVSGDTAFYYNDSLLYVLSFRVACRCCCCGRCCCYCGIGFVLLPVLRGWVCPYSLTALRRLHHFFCFLDFFLFFSFSFAWR
ncbi:hypothetical protein F5144DRAFT_143954 [Chaetomium tenue]|uniref:Uncharacterized protein n=1 Tax=Chaetomium tenue TaxID=1854479 RepID=A0ACB7PPG8_9PEZI|nr:hypothetical protein F5144DRAFT_143954 [Chaetomium globosum]